jgi:hypothetical protein
LKNLVKLAICLVLLSGIVRMGYSRGDKIIPQVVAGVGDDGRAWVTKFDLTNVSSAIPIANMRLAFFRNNGTAWNLQTNQGTGNFALPTLQPRQTLRVQAAGGISFETGYAIIYDEEEGNSEYSEDYVLGISVFYQVSSGTGVVENVSIPVREPTAAATVPIEINDAQGIYSAVAIVNTANVPSSILLSLYNSNGTLYGTRILTLAAREQRTAFLDYDPALFPELKSFSGMAELTGSDTIETRPFVLLSLRQTRAADFSQQYTLLVPVDKESLRRNSYMVLLQANDDGNPYMPIDIDGFTSDFYRTAGGTEAYSWDLEYWYNDPNTEDRFLKPVNYSEIFSLGIRNDGQFDALSLPDLKALTTYSTANIDISTASQNQTFAIRTDLRNYAKARIIRIIETYDGFRWFQDLVMEVVVYK